MNNLSLIHILAELGDKTQLTAITFGANEGMNAALIVWIACSLGLFAADILGMLAGYLLMSFSPWNSVYTPNTEKIPNTSVLSLSLIHIFR